MILTLTKLSLCLAVLAAVFLHPVTLWAALIALGALCVAVTHSVLTPIR
ncbi:MAG TPA: hypothetical protein PKZ76_03300 [Xanthomonadaceae bacterium]|nr:hypothetical protein [Xanthomonadaceae bacterium]